MNPKGKLIIIGGHEDKDVIAINKTNINEVNSETPIVIENLKVHIIAEGSTFLIEERKFQ